MKIAATAQHIPADKLRVAARSDGDTERQKDNFADLLAAMRSSRDYNGKRYVEAGSISVAQEHNADIRAADFAPRIGTSGKAFGEGRLLVETAVVFRDLADATNSPRLHDLLRATLEIPGEQGGAAIPASTGKTFGSFLADCLAAALLPATETGGQTFRLSYPTGTCQQAPRQTDASNASAKVQAWPGAAAESEPAGVAESSAPASTSRAQKFSSPFGAQLAFFEGGLRLLLRLPRLADGQRAELNAALARLFESFGHRNHEIVIQEIGRGDS